jgi:hypothetical protein
MSRTVPSGSDPSATPASAARAAANRANAQLSTGPRTPEGKARSSINALKLGLFSRQLDLAAERLGEDSAEFAALHADLTAEYRPEGRDESMLVDRMAALWWRLQRLAAQQQTYLAERLKAANPLMALKESEVCSLHEARLDRMLRATRKDLLARQGWRLGATERRVTALRRTWEAEKAERRLASEAHDWQAAQARVAAARAQDAERAAYEAAGPHPAPPGGNGAAPNHPAHPGPATGSSA